MDDAKSELVRTWLIKARNDLGSANRLAEQIFNFVIKRLPEDVRPPGQPEIKLKNNTLQSPSQEKDSGKKNDQMNVQ